MLYWVQVPHNTRYTAVEMQRWSGGMQCMVVITVVSSVGVRGVYKPLYEGRGGGWNVCCR